MIFPLLKNWLAPLLPSTVGSSNTKSHKVPDSGFRTIGGGPGSGGVRASRTAPHRARHTFGGLTFDNESEEDMVTGDDVIIHRMQETSVQPEGKHVIVVLNEYCVTSEDRCSARSKTSF
jgi:hypothetical protein